MTATVEELSMKVFIAWSGDRSHAVAVAFRNWLPLVIQVVKPYVSSKDIDKGARWAEEISHQLAESNYGIICVTTDSLEAPWLHFEAGALSKLEKSRVTPFLFDVETAQVQGPLTLFQATRNNRDEIQGLVQSVNRGCESPIELGALAETFDKWWPDLEQRLQGIATDPALQPQQTAPQVSDRELLEELVDRSRSQQRQLDDLLGHRRPRQRSSRFKTTWRNRDFDKLTPVETVSFLDMSGVERYLDSVPPSERDQPMPQLLNDFRRQLVIGGGPLNRFVNLEAHAAADGAGEVEFDLLPPAS